jgi:hypothetical protein
MQINQTFAARPEHAKIAPNKKGDPFGSPFFAAANRSGLIW